MTFSHRIASFLAFGLILAISAFGQTTASLTGDVTTQGRALPGVTVSARSEALIQPVSSVSDAEGYYRLINLPPGTYELMTFVQGN